MEEGKIPVFTVLKNNAILKNIFILNKPNNASSSSYSDHEDILILGRHPDCDIMLTHPSISRFHLHITSKPSSQSLSLIDLSSVHGTWVSERKVEAGVSVDMKEGDTLRIGASSRIYRLHWIPISQAYHLEKENPFLSDLDLLFEPKNVEQELLQNMNCCPDEMEQIQSEDSILECMKLLFFDENLEVIVEKESPAAPPMPEDIISLCCPDERKSPFKVEAFGFLSEPCGTKTSYLPTTSDWEKQLCDSLNQELIVKTEIASAPPMPEGIISFCCEEDMRSQSKDERFVVPSDPFGTKTSYLHTSSDWKELCGSLNQELTVKEEIASAAPPMPEGIISFCCEEEMRSQSKDETFRVPTDFFGTENELCDSLNQVLPLPHVESFVDGDSTLKEYFSESGCFPVAEAVQGTNMHQFHTPPDAFTSPLPPDQEDLFQRCHSILPINTEPPSFDWKSAAEAVIPEESEFGCSVRDENRDSTAAAVGNFNSENTLLPVEEVVCDSICQQIKVVEEIALDSPCDGEKQDTCGEENKSELQSHLNAKYCSLDEIVQIESVNSSTPQKAVLKIIKEKKIPKSDDIGSYGEPMKKKSTTSNIWSRRGKVASAPQIRTSKSTLKSKVSVDTKVAKSNLKDIRKQTTSKDLLSVLAGQEEEEEVFTPDKENLSPNTLQLRFLKKKGKLEEIKHSNSKRSHNSKDTFSPDIYPNKSISPNPSKENHKEESKTISKDIFSVLDGEEEEIFTPDKENFSPNSLRLRLLKKKSNTIAKDLFSVLDAEEEDEDIFTPDKENFSPNTPRVRLQKKKVMLEETKCSESMGSQSSKANSSPNISPDERISSTSNNENQTLKVLQEHKSRRKPFGSHIKMVQEQDIMASKSRVERLPFQPLKNTEGKSRSKTSCPVSATESIDVSNCGQNIAKHINASDINGEPKKSWDMVVDIACLMNKDSRKALQLLKGLKGTRLIIPRLVIRELNRMKQQFTIFRRISESSLALEWIEECMVKTNWWIHIQSSMDVESMIVPTPPAFPHTQFSWQSLSFHKSSLEVASPTIEDNILDFVIFYRRRQNDGQLVLLSEDVTLKIKCMAEGLLCETVQEFRESLVNPFSERFLWTNSSPRGQTWSCQDDVILREKYCPLPKRKSSKGVATGLKLILLHNSQYRR
ncbi:hypothetical protein RIF29_18485 [Crotalaria pallida]|uniref:FHA domain-containing protein n=1 Tax=Crotalaria pallida TaxID=3830 RepID=A0AAN9FJ45_CROPI